MVGFLGEIRPFAGTFAPQSWALCDGSSLSVNDYQALYSLIGNTYGGNTVNFALPNLCGRTTIKLGAGAALSNYTLAQTGGLEAVLLAPANLAPHTHTVTVSTSNAATDIPTNNYLAAMVDTGNPTFVVKSYLPNNDQDTNQVLVPLHQSTISPAIGGNFGHENRMPYMVMNFIICIQGVYPDFQ